MKAADTCVRFGMMSEVPLIADVVCDQHDNSNDSAITVILAVVAFGNENDHGNDHD